MSCLKCDLQLKDDQFCECDGCRRGIHYACADLTASEIKCVQLKNKRTLKFFCEACLEGIRLIPVLQKQIDTLQSRFDKFIKDQTINQSNSNTNTVMDISINYDSFLSEIEDRKQRAKNIMVYNIPEQSGGNDLNKADSDKEVTKEIIATVSEVSKIKKVIRVGKTGEKPRPLKVILDNPQTALLVLRNKSKISHPSAKISADLTLNQRNHLKKLRNQLEKRISDGEANLTIKYVRGVPKIVDKVNPKNM